MIWAILWLTMLPSMPDVPAELPNKTQASVLSRMLVLQDARSAAREAAGARARRQVVHALAGAADLCHAVPGTRDRALQVLVLGANMIVVWNPSASQSN